MNFAISVIAKTTILLTCAALLSLVMGRASASFRHAVWVVAMISILLLPLTEMLVPQLEILILSESTSVTFRSAGDSSGVIRVEGGTVPVEPLWHAVLGSVRLLYTWTAGLVLLLVRLLAGSMSVRRLAKRATPARRQDWHALVAEVSQSLYLNRPVRLLFSDAPVSPMTWGVFRHTILLPSSATDWSEDRRRFVLAHELAHVKRNDGMFQMFAHVVCSIYWFNPIVWYAARRIRIERERACDDRVLNSGTIAEDYADHLIQIVRSLRVGRGLPLAAVSMAHPSLLETRLVSILDPRTRRRRLSKIGTAFLCGCAGLVTVSMARLGVTTAVPLPVPLVVNGGPPIPTPLEPEPANSTAKPRLIPQRTRIGDPGAIQTNTVIPPRVIESTPPVYTDEALAAVVEGTVTLEADVDAEGNARILRVIKGIGYGLDERAMQAAGAWKFAPALRNGVPVQAITQIDVDYKLPTFIRPSVIRRVEPKYTPEARELRLQGTVILEAVVKEDGSCEVKRVVQSLEPSLDESAVQAISQWRFRPARREGKTVDITLNIEVNFNLR